jgi:hypothetical protein
MPDTNVFDRRIWNIRAIISFCHCLILHKLKLWTLDASAKYVNTFLTASNACRICSISPRQSRCISSLKQLSCQADTVLLGWFLSHSHFLYSWILKVSNTLNAMVVLKRYASFVVPISMIYSRSRWNLTLNSYVFLSANIFVWKNS